MSREVNLEALKQVFSVGSGDWSWEEEHDDIEERTPGKLDLLAQDIRWNGIKEPIILGDDGRVWDGHHRILAATIVGLGAVPVEFSGDRL